MIKVFSERCFWIDCKTVFAFSPLQQAHDVTWQYMTHGRSMNALCTFSLGNVYVG